MAALLAAAAPAAGVAPGPIPAAPPPRYFVDAAQDHQADAEALFLAAFALVDDPIVRRHPLLSSALAWALRDSAGTYIDCGRSALTIARELAGLSPATTHEHFQHVAGLSVGAMTRLTGRRLNDFPVYIYRGGEWPNARYHLVSGKPRRDGWAIVYLPADLFLAVPHWAFFQVSFDEADEAFRARFELYQRVPVLFMGELPLVRADPLVPLWWKGGPDGVAEYLSKAISEGWACNCCLKIVCVHEVRFLRQNPNAKVLFCRPSTIVDGLHTVEVECAFPLPRTLLSRARLNHSLHLRFEADSDLNRQRVYPTLSYGMGVSDLTTGHFFNLNDHRQTHSIDMSVPVILHQLGFFDRFPVLTTYFRYGNTWAESVFPFYHWAVDFPEQEERIRVGQFGVVARLFPNRTLALLQKKIARRLATNLALTIGAFAISWSLLRVANALFDGAAALWLWTNFERVETTDVMSEIKALVYDCWVYPRLPWYYRALSWSHPRLKTAGGKTVYDLVKPPTDRVFPPSQDPLFYRLCGAIYRVPGDLVSFGWRAWKSSSWKSWMIQPWDVPSRVNGWIDALSPQKPPEPAAYLKYAAAATGLTPAALSERIELSIRRISPLPAAYKTRILQGCVSLIFSGSCWIVRMATALAKVPTYVWGASLFWCGASSIRDVIQHVYYSRFPRSVSWRRDGREMGSLNDMTLAMDDPEVAKVMSEFVARCRMRRSVDAATAHQIFADVARRAQYLPSGIPRELLEEAIFRQLHEPAYGTDVKVVKPELGACWRCKRRMKIYKLLCKGCRAKNRHMVPAPPNMRSMRFEVEDVSFLPMRSIVAAHPTPPSKPALYGVVTANDSLYIPRNVAVGRNITLLDFPNVSWRKEKTTYYHAAGPIDQCTHTFANFWHDVLPYEPRATTQRGQAVGMVFQGCEPACFPRGTATAVAAYLIRNQADRVHWKPDGERPAVLLYRLLIEVMKAFSYEYKGAPVVGIPELIPETEEEWLEHIDDPKKREQMREALELLRLGETPKLVPRTFVAVDDPTDQITVHFSQFKAFTKSEKMERYTWDEDTRSWVEKSPLKPRCICVPDVLLLARLGRYTHVQTKWLAAMYHRNFSMYYAGCATPEELNEWGNDCLAEYPEPLKIDNDVVAMDSDHSPDSGRAGQRIDEMNYPGDRDTLMYLASVMYVFIAIAGFKGVGCHFLPSGVPNTSFRNSTITGGTTIIAFTHATFGLFIVEKDADGHITRFALLPHLNEERVVMLILRAMQYFRGGVSGDDSTIFTTPKVCGVTVGDAEWIERYQDVWKAAGFATKPIVHQPSKWRLSTFLACRLVWSDAGRYEWAPEPSRRLRKMFWQFENNCHPVAWARGLCTQILVMAPHAPVLADVARWYLDKTHGPAIAETGEFNKYNPIWKSRAQGKMCQRTIDEFCLDYEIPQDEYHFFVRSLAEVDHVMVNINCFVFEQLIAHEC